MASGGFGVEEIGAPRRWRGGWGPAAAMVGAWTIANALWFEHHRGARLWDHEEVGYVQQVSRVARLRDGSELWDALHSDHQGPMQALLGAPPQWLFGTHEATVIWQNIGLTAVTGCLVYWMVHRLADRGAALAATALVLLTPGMLENSRGALTMVAATTFGALALAALVAGGGLRRWSWSMLAGAAVGCMVLSRPMAVAFVPGLAVPAIVWARAGGASWRDLVRNGAIAGATAVAVSAWWWTISYRDVIDYLSVGAPNVGTGSPTEVLDHRLFELKTYLGPVVFSSQLGLWPRVAAAGALVLYLRGHVPAAVRRTLPLWATLGVVLSFSPIFGVMPLVAGFAYLVFAYGSQGGRDAFAHWPVWAAVVLGTTVAPRIGTTPIAASVASLALVAAVTLVRRHPDRWARHAAVGLAAIPVSWFVGYAPFVAGFVCVVAVAGLRLRGPDPHLWPIGVAVLLAEHSGLVSLAFVLAYVAVRRRSGIVTADGRAPTVVPSSSVDDGGLPDPLGRRIADAPAPSAVLTIQPEPATRAPLPTGSTRPSGRLAIWPIWAAVGTDLLVSLTSNTIGWLMLPLVPWIVVATTAGVRRSLPASEWKWWATLMVVPISVVAVLSSTLWATPGNRFTWCMEPWQVTSACRIDDDAEAAQWKGRLDAIARDASDLDDALRADGRTAAIAIVARGHIVLSPSITLEAWLNEGHLFDDIVSIPLDRPVDEQLEQIRREADIVVVVPDPEPVSLFLDLVDPDALATELPADGFDVCRSVELPDGRVVELLVRGRAPTGACQTNG